MKVIGIDSGSTTTKAVVVENDKIIKSLIVPTSYNPRNTMVNLIKALEVDKDTPVFSTGYGRNLIETAHKSLTEITCHAAGAKFLHKDAHIVLDIGGQDSKVIKMDSNGQVIDFLMNDKCAAGTGRFMEVMMRILHKDLMELDLLVSEHKAVKISSMCAVFAESEVIGLLAKEISPGDIALGVINSICERSANFVKRIGGDEPVFLSGGLAQSEVIRTTLGKYLGHKVYSHDQSQLAGAIGAALLGIKQLSK